jgi:hypothetical protein
MPRGSAVPEVSFGSVSAKTVEAVASNRVNKMKKDERLFMAEFSSN